MLPVLLSVITRALVTSDNCFGGVETFEKLASSNFEPNTVPMAGVLLQQANVSLTRDCINLCRQQQRCTVFNLDYQQFQCSAFVESSRRHRDHLQPSKSTNLFEKICLKGLARQDFDQICGNERLWAFERVKDYFLDGFVDKELINMADREECAKACLTESSFICRSADFDEVKRVCRLSAENRRSQPQAFVYAKNSQRDYIENQCAPSGPASCVYTTKSNTNVFSMDSLQFATSSDECQLQCDRELSFNCRSFGFINNRCMLSSDDEKSIGKQHPLFSLKGSIYGERTCVAELCTNGIFTYEKITGHLLRSAITTPVDLPEYSLLGLTNWCRESCDQAQLNCPAFSINYKNSRCERLDRNTQGRTADLIATEGESYFEKICLRVPQIMSQCQDKFWAFERVLGYELAPVLYIKTLNFVQSRRDCQEYCLQEREFPCRSALYNDETTECKLSQEDRRTSPGHYYRSRSMKINYLENQCVRIHSACPYQRTENAYPAYTDIVETNSVQSSNACEKLCNDNRYFLCRSYAYYPSNSQCFLSGDDSVSAGSSSIQHRSNIVYYERQCSKLPNFDSNAMFDKTDHKIIEEEDDDLDHLDRDSHHLQHPDQFVGTVPDQSSSLSTSIDRIGETSTLTPPTSSRISPFYSPSSAFSPSSQMTSSGSMPTTLSTNGGISMSPSITTSNLNRNKGVVILNGTLGGIITTKTTRFPESLLPTITPPTLPSSQRSIMNEVKDSNNLPSTLSYDHGSSHRDQHQPYHSTVPYTENPHDLDHDKVNDNNVNHNKQIPIHEENTIRNKNNNEIGPNDSIHFSNNKKCPPNSRFLFEKVTSFEPIGGHLTLLYTDLQNPGIVTECASRCEHSARCRAFVIDYFHQTCHGLFENSSVGLLDLRLSMGKDYFEGFCVPNHANCQKYWPFDRIIDQAVIGAQPGEIVRFVSRSECRDRCLEEQKFRCSSASYNSFTHECHLYSHDRDSGSLYLQFNKGIDFMENQCVIDVKSCRYHPIERDLSIVSVTKSVRGTSTFHCEQACDFERDFNCRSYTYLDNPDGSVAPGGNLCLLSSDNRATSHQGSIQFRPRALYAEKDCVYRSKLSPIHHQSPSSDPNFSTNQQHHHHHHLPNQDSSSHQQQQFPGNKFINQRPISLTSRQMDTFSDEKLTDPSSRPTIQQQHEQHEMKRIQSNFLSNYWNDNQSILNMKQLQHIPHVCSPEEYSFEKTFGYDLRYAQRKLAPFASRPGIAILCKDECLRLGEQCKAFTIEYGPEQNQNCYFLSESASENRNQLNKLIGTSYNEKICLREKTCDSTWAFERIIGYRMELEADLEIDSIMFRTTCQDLCLMSKQFQCRSLTYDYGRRICKLFHNTRRSKPEAFVRTTDHIDYFENKCTKELLTCQYREYNDRYFEYIDKIVPQSKSLVDCQRKCDSETSFHCKSVNYDPKRSECYLSSEDSSSINNINDDGERDGWKSHRSLDDSFISTTSSLMTSSSDANYPQKHHYNRNQKSPISPMAIHQAGTIFSEKGNCEQVSVQCNQQDMMLTLNFDAPFYGRVYTKNNPSQCFVNGDGQLRLKFSIPLDSSCGTYHERTSSYVNEVIVQQHSVIMTDNDRTIRVLCSFEVSDQTITLGNVENYRHHHHHADHQQHYDFDNRNQQELLQQNIPIPMINGIDVSTNPHGRSYSDHKTPATIVTNTAAPPSIRMRILDHKAQDAQVVSLGDDLTLRIELLGQSGESPYAIFARNLYARSSNGESLFLIDNNGCPTDSTIFPALQLDSVDQRSLYSKFKAFRFPSTGVVNFEVQIRFCQDFCDPIKCTQLNNKDHFYSFGRRRKRNTYEWFDSVKEQANLNEERSPLMMMMPWNRSLENRFQTIINHTDDENGNNFLNYFQSSSEQMLGNSPTTTTTIDSDHLSDSERKERKGKSSTFRQTGFSYPSNDYLHYRNHRNNDDNGQIFYPSSTIATELQQFHRPPLDTMRNGNDYADQRQFISKEFETKQFKSNNSTDLFYLELLPSQSFYSIPPSSSVSVLPESSSSSSSSSLSATAEASFDQNLSEQYVKHGDVMDRIEQRKIVTETIRDNQPFFIQNDDQNLDQIIKNNAALPMPRTFSSEVPLSLAIMVDEDDHDVGSNDHSYRDYANDDENENSNNNNNNNNYENQNEPNGKIQNRSGLNPIIIVNNEKEINGDDDQVSDESSSPSSLTTPESETTKVVDERISNNNINHDLDDDLDDRRKNQQQQQQQQELQKQSNGMNSPERNQPNNSQQYADFAAARISSRNSLLHSRINSDTTIDKLKPKELQSICSDYCTNTGIIIFLTTLIVTIVHLTLGAMIYFYVIKLKKSKRFIYHQTNQMLRDHHQRNLDYYHNYERRFSSFNNSTSETPTSTLERDQNFMEITNEDPSFFGDENDGDGRNVDIGFDCLIKNIRCNENSMNTFCNDTNGMCLIDAKRKHSQRQQHQQNKHQEDARMMSDNVVKISNRYDLGNLKSSFNRDNVFFGPKEQRFFGINNYAFPNTLSKHHRNDDNTIADRDGIIQTNIKK